jgi:chemotaxis protein MotB
MEEEEAPGVPEWVVTYGDMMSLLLTFFIMLVSMSELKGDGSIRAMLDAINEAFGPTSGSYGAPGDSMQKTSAYPKPNSGGSGKSGGTKKANLEKAKGRGGPNSSANRINHGKSNTLGGPAAFGDNGWELSETLKKELDDLIEILKTKNKKIMVRGHSSTRPYPKNIKLDYPHFSIKNRWDLSFARALEVSNYLVNTGRIDKERVVVSAVGDTEPHTIYRDPDSGENFLKGINRRVDVFLIDSYIKSKESEE